jgi:tripartite-type tricarboxylate transporter receptor subunit TctC
LLGAEHVARAEPDGYTILTMQTSFATNAALRAKMPYDVFKEFAKFVLADVSRWRQIVKDIGLKLE